MITSLSVRFTTAIVIGEVIRVVHASREPDNAALAAVRRYFAAPPESVSESVPVPLSISMWRDLLGNDVTDASLVGALLQDRRAAMLLTRSGRGHWPVCG